MPSEMSEARIEERNEESSAGKLAVGDGKEEDVVEDWEKTVDARAARFKRMYFILTKMAMLCWWKGPL